MRAFLVLFAVLLLLPGVKASETFSFGRENIVSFPHDPARRLYPVISGGKWGFIDRTGKAAISPRFHEVSHFYNGRARVKIDGKYGYIDETGDVVIPPVYGGASDFSEGTAVVSLPVGVCRSKGALIDTKGRQLFEPIEDAYIRVLNEGLASCCVKEENTVGGTPGNWMIIPVQSACTDNIRRKCGFINRQGKMVIPAVYHSTGDFSEGLAFVRFNLYESGYIDRTGNVVIRLQYNRSNTFSEGLAFLEFIEKSNRGYGYINRKGEIAIRLKSHPPFDYSCTFSEGMTVAYGETKEKMGYIDTSGKMVIAPRRFDFLRNFHEGLAAAGAMNKAGYIDRKGNWVIMPKYSYSLDFSNGIAPVLVKKRNELLLGYIDRKGREIWSPQR